ncbi:hypothetical protein D9M68_518380 [compost metagenome]
MAAGAVLGWDVGVDGGRGEGLQDAHLLGLPEVAGVDGKQQVGYAVLPFGLDPLHQRRFLVGDELDLHTGLGGVGIEYRLDQFVDPRGVDHHFIGRLGRNSGGGQRQEREKGLAYSHCRSLM